jgi:transposase
MWKPEHRRSADRPGLRYPSDLTDAEWALEEPLIPPARRGGRPRDVNVREVLNAIFYVLSTGCQWQTLPKDLPPKSRAHYYFMLWDGDPHAGAHPPRTLRRGARAGRPRSEPDGGDHR